MDIDAIAKKAREKIFARVEDDRCLHASSVEEEIVRAIREAMPQPSWYGGVVAVGFDLSFESPSSKKTIADVISAKRRAREAASAGDTETPAERWARRTKEGWLPTGIAGPIAGIDEGEWR